LINNFANEHYKLKINALLKKAPGKLLYFYEIIFLESRAYIVSNQTYVIIFRRFDFQVLLSDMCRCMMNLRDR